MSTFHGKSYSFKINCADQYCLHTIYKLLPLFVINLFSLFLSLFLFTWFVFLDCFFKSIAAFFSNPVTEFYFSYMWRCAQCLNNAVYAFIRHLNIREVVLGQSFVPYKTVVHSLVCSRIRVNLWLFWFRLNVRYCLCQVRMNGWFLFFFLFWLRWLGLFGLWWFQSFLFFIHFLLILNRHLVFVIPQLGT